MAAAGSVTLTFLSRVIREERQGKLIRFALCWFSLKSEKGGLKGEVAQRTAQGGFRRIEDFKFVLLVNPFLQEIQHGLRVLQDQEPLAFPDVSCQRGIASSREMA